MVHVLAKRARADIEGRCRALHLRVSDKARDVELVGAAGLNRRALLQSEKVIEPLDKECAAHRVVKLDFIHALLRDASIARFRLKRGRWPPRLRPQPYPSAPNIARRGPSYLQPGMREK